ncbi:LexA family transcriptional regulator [Vibrio sp.]|uniref:LexA family transcriptional regulator n=1 Tax=Vibrio sp. TaxID=678 RepID=UPI003AA9308C
MGLKNMVEKDSNSSNDPIENKGNGSLSERILLLMKGRSARQVAEDWGIGASTVNAYVKNGSIPNLNIAHQIACREGVNLEWLATGRGEMLAIDEPMKPIFGISDVAESYATSNEMLEFYNEFVLIPGYRIQVSAGHGTNPLGGEEEPCRHLAFRRKWLKWRGFSEKDLAIVWAKGDSMEPTINNNDTLVVHLGRTVPQDGHIYVFRNGEELFVKRYQSMIGTWRLISDNKAYSMMDIKKEEQHQFQVIGQVVHIAKDLGN